MTHPQHCTISQPIIKKLVGRSIGLQPWGTKHLANGEVMCDNW